MITFVYFLNYKKIEKIKNDNLETKNIFKIFLLFKTHVFSIEFFYTDTHILKKTKYDQSLYNIDKIHNM